MRLYQKILATLISSTSLALVAPATQAGGLSFSFNSHGFSHYGGHHKFHGHRHHGGHKFHSYSYRPGIVYYSPYRNYHYKPYYRYHKPRFRGHHRFHSRGHKFKHFKHFKHRRHNKHFNRHGIGHSRHHSLGHAIGKKHRH